jgi:hypothetical protein
MIEPGDEGEQRREMPAQEPATAPVAEAAADDAGGVVVPDADEAGIGPAGGLVDDPGPAGADDRADEGVADAAVDAAVDADGDGPADANRAAAWPLRALQVSVGLEVVVAVLLLGDVLQGVAASTKEGSVWARMGAAFVGDAGTSHGLALLIAAGLACWASGSGERWGRIRPPRVLTGCLVLAALLCAATPLAMAGDVAYLHHTHQAVTGVTRWGLVTFFFLTFVPALAAAAVSWWGLQDTR